MASPPNGGTLTTKTAKITPSSIFHFDDWKNRFRVDAGFTTRHCPVFLSKTDDLLNPIHQENLKKQFPFSSRFIFLNQVHGANVAVLKDKDKFTKDGFYHLPGTDGVITNVRGLSLLVLTADCLPIYFVAGEWIGLAHAGWRGAKEGIAGKTFKLLLEKSKCKPSQVRILFGPCICRNHYEVGKEFQQFFPKTTRRQEDFKLTFDLAEENKKQLVHAGALDKNIEDLEICTVCENSAFYSYRREKDTAGRLISFIRKI